MSFVTSDDSGNKDIKKIGTFPVFMVSILGVLLMACLNDDLQGSEIVRKAAAAGQFYPHDPQELRDVVTSYIADNPFSQTSPRLLISPHAGYVFSGSVAGKGYSNLSPGIKRVFIIGPSHHVWFKGIYVSSATCYETPLGKVALDQHVVNDLKKSLLCANVHDAEGPEHCLEVQLPFLQVKLDDFKIVPILLGDVDPARVAELIYPFLNDSTIAIASSDLSHYHSNSEARMLDGRSIETILSGDTGGFFDGCGKVPVQVIMNLARKMDLHPVKVDAKTSFETAPQFGSKTRVVGYVSIVYEKKTDGMSAVTAEKNATLTVDHQKILLQFARESLCASVKKEILQVPVTIPAALKESLGCFVTITKTGSLRGCIGYIEPIKPLIEAVIDNAGNAALHDPRFTPVTIDELGKVSIEISVLTKPEQLSFDGPDDLLSKLIPMVHGVILQKGNRQSTFLPQVWCQLPEKIKFLEHLSVKAGMQSDGWKTSNVKIYTAQHFQE
jgi:AmmeMemoRadiSam system protein B/AmmeMemoRadiSam system protein A